ncbi:MAG: hypothetical protein IKL84_02410 [Clostridia bacterium]|nr:hypothetical protein [Clostridia bacterium]
MPEATLEFSKTISSVRRNENVTVSIRGNPNTAYMIKVIYASGTVSKAKGLNEATSDASGSVSWTWKIGAKTGFGPSRIEVTDGKTTIVHHFEVVEG